MYQDEVENSHVTSRDGLQSKHMLKTVFSASPKGKIAFRLLVRGIREMKMNFLLTWVPSLKCNCIHYSMQIFQNLKSETLLFQSILDKRYRVYKDIVGKLESYVD